GDADDRLHLLAGGRHDDRGRGVVGPRLELERVAEPEELVLGGQDLVGAELGREVLDRGGELVLRDAGRAPDGSALLGGQAEYDHGSLAASSLPSVAGPDFSPALAFRGRRREATGQAEACRGSHLQKG